MGTTEVKKGDKSKGYYIRVNRHKGAVQGTYKLYEFYENDSYIIYAPQVNLSSYGADKKEAFDMFMFVVDDFHKSLINLSDSAVINVLGELGWTKRKIGRKNFGYSGAYIDSKGVLKEFDLPEDTEIKEAQITV